MLRTWVRRGDLNCVRAKAVASTAIAVGDIIYWDSSAHTAKPASSYAAQVTLALLQAAIHNNFLGISQDQRLAAQTSTGDILVATKGIVEIPCKDSASAYDPGAFFGIDGLEDTTFTGKNQQVVAVADATLAIGRLVEYAAAHATTVKIELDPTLITGGAHAISS